MFAKVKQTTLKASNNCLFSNDSRVLLQYVMGQLLPPGNYVSKAVKSMLSLQWEASALAFPRHRHSNPKSWSPRERADPHAKLATTSSTFDIAETLQTDACGFVQNNQRLANFFLHQAASQVPSHKLLHVLMSLTLCLCVLRSVFVSGQSC